MKADLDRLKVADPTTYEKYISSPAYIYDYSERQKMAWLQAVLQEAISAKGWQGIILFNQERNRAVIEDIVDGWGGTRKLSELEGDSPAAALLAAYITALEATCQK